MRWHLASPIIIFVIYLFISPTLPTPFFFKREQAVTFCLDGRNGYTEGLLQLESPAVRN